MFAVTDVIRDGMKIGTFRLRYKNVNTRIVRF